MNPPLAIDADRFAARVRALLGGRGGRRPWPRRQQDRWVLLHAVGRRIHPGEALPERDANARIQNWLLGPGAAIEADFVTIRRALIDEGFWDRDSGGASYRRSRVHERRVTFAADLPDEDEILHVAGGDAIARAEAHRRPDPA